MLFSTLPTLLAMALGVQGNIAHAAMPEIANPNPTLTSACISPEDVAVEPEMAMEQVGAAALPEARASIEELTAAWNEFIEWLGGIFTPGPPEVAAFSPEQLVLLDAAMTAEEANVWYESQPQDELGIPLVTEEEARDMTIEVEMLADMLAGERLGSRERERVEATILIKVALIEANRFGSDVREDLLSLLETRLPSGQAIEPAEAEMLASVARGEVLLFEVLPILPVGFVD